ncbi:MAG: TetR family transcriptional regulator [Saprospiraceae bacterium]
MESAEILFSENGFDGTSVRDIAEKAGVNLAMISYYFGSKEKLMESIFHYRSERLTDQLNQMLRDSLMSSMEKINNLIDSYIDKFLQQTCFHRIMVREQLTNAKGPMGEMILKVKTNNYNLINQLIKEGQKRGEFTKPIDIGMMMATLIGTVNHILSTQHYYRDMENLQDLSEEQFRKHIRKKLSVHLKSLFKSSLIH